MSGDVCGGHDREAAPGIEWMGPGRLPHPPRCTESDRPRMSAVLRRVSLAAEALGTGCCVLSSFLMTFGLLSAGFLVVVVLETLGFLHLFLFFPSIFFFF